MTGWEATASGGTDRRRGQTSVVAVVLLVGMVLTGATLVVYVGTQALEQRQERVSFSTATQSMQSLDAEIEKASRGQRSEISVRMPEGNGEVRMVAKSPSNPARAGKVTIEIDPPSGPVKTKTVWLGTLYYEQGNRTVAYQGGGVWEATGNGSVAVTPPPVNYRKTSNGGTLKFPLVALDGKRAGSKFDVELAGSQSLLSSLNLRNPLEPGTTITVTLRSNFYHAWARELTDELGASAVSTNPGAKTVTVTLSNPDTAPEVTAAAYSYGPASELTSTVVSDSYQPPNYVSASASQSGDIYTTDVFDPTAQLFIQGNVYAEDGSNQITSQIEVTGNVVLGNDDPTVGPTTINADPTFGGLFSTMGDLIVDGDISFQGSLIVNGTADHGNNYALKFNSGASVIEGSVYVNGSLNLKQDPLIKGDVYVKNGDILNTIRGEIRGNVYVENGDATIGKDYYGDLRIEGDVIVEGDVDLGGSDVVITGDVIAGGTVYEGPTNAQVAGDIYENHDTTVENRLDSRNFENPEDPSVPHRSSMTSEIQSKRAAFSADNNNGGAGVVGVSGQSLVDPCNPCELPAGNYYLDEIVLSGTEELILDTSSGAVNIYVEEKIRMINQGEIEIRGSNRANVYVGGSSSKELYMTNTAKVITRPDEEVASRFWLYLKPTAEVKMDDHPDFTGVIYGPPGPSGSGAEVRLTSDAEIFGAVVGHVTAMDAGARLHYDESLASAPTFPGSSGSTTTIQYVHFTRQTATVRD